MNKQPAPQTAHTPFDTTPIIRSQRLVVLVQRHLALETQLASSLESLNEATTQALSSPGLRGPTQEDVQRLEPMTKDVQASASVVAQARGVLMARIKAETGKGYASIGEVIAELPQSVALSLDEIRSDILARCDLAQTRLVNNQATLHYTFDFHRKYLAGVFQQDCEEQNYSANGQSQEPPRGNLFGRTC